MWATVLTPYAGYAHVVPRTLAAVIAVFPFGVWAPATAVVSALARASIAVLLWYALADHIPSRAYRWVMAAVVVLMPVAGMEVLNNLANLHWFLIVAGVVCAAWSPRRVGGTVVRIAVMVLAVLSDPLALVALPVLIAQLIRSRGRQDLAALVAVVAAAVVQLGVVFGTARTPAEDPVGPADFLWTYAIRIVFGAPSGFHLAEAWYRHPVAVVVVVCAVVVCVAIGITTRGPQRFLAVYTASVSVGLYAAMMHFTPSAEPLIPAANLDVRYFSRYTVVAGLLLLIAVLAGASVRSPRWASLIGRTAGGVLLTVFMVGVFVDLGTSPTEDRVEWSEMVPLMQDRCSSGAGTVSVPIEPLSWQFVVPCSVVER